MGRPVSIRNTPTRPFIMKGTRRKNSETTSDGFYSNRRAASSSQDQPKHGCANTDSERGRGQIDREFARTEGNRESVLAYEVRSSGNENYRSGIRERDGLAGLT